MTPNVRVEKIFLSEDTIARSFFVFGLGYCNPDHFFVLSACGVGNFCPHHFSLLKHNFILWICSSAKKSSQHPICSKRPGCYGKSTGGCLLTAPWESHPRSVSSPVCTKKVSLTLMHVFAVQRATLYPAAGLLAIRLFSGTGNSGPGGVFAYPCPCSIHKECTCWLVYSVVKVFVVFDPFAGFRNILPSTIYWTFFCHLSG